MSKNFLHYRDLFSTEFFGGGKWKFRIFVIRYGVAFESVYTLTYRICQL